MIKKYSIYNLIVFSLLFFSTSSFAVLYDFDSGTSGFTLYGDAIVNSGSIQLTAPAIGQSGSIFLDTALNATSFSASFDYWNAEPRYGVYGGDGITFAWATSPGIGGGGGELGFTGLNGYMVEFDTYWNSGYDPADTLYNGDDTDHVAVGTEVSSTLAYAILPEMEENGWHHIDVAFDNGLIQVAFDGIEYINYSIADYVGFDAYFGFTGSTGASFSRQLIDNFDLTINQSSEPVPEPSTLLLLGGGLAGLAWCRRKRKKA